MPSSPCTIVGLRPGARHVLEQWWALAKRHAFREWNYLINSPTGMFLVTKCVKTRRFAHCLSKGPQGQTAQIHIHGMQAVPRANDNIELPANGTYWQVLTNDLEFEIHDSGGNKEYTVFIERDASRLFAVTDGPLRDAAQKLWT
jgi:hypothetical protein